MTKFIPSVLHLFKCYNLITDECIDKLSLQALKEQLLDTDYNKLVEEIGNFVDLSNAKVFDISLLPDDISKQDEKCMNNILICNVICDNIEFFTYIANNDSIYEFKCGLFEQFGEFKIIEMTADEDFITVDKEIVDSSDIINSHFNAKILIYERAIVNDTSISISIEDDFSFNDSLVDDLLSLTISEEDVHPYSNYYGSFDDIDSIDTEDKLVEKSYLSFTQAIIYCNFLYKRQYRNIKIIRRPKNDNEYLRICCEDSKCNFKLYCKKNGDFWNIYSLTPHTCNPDQFKFKWNPIKETMIFIFQKEYKLPACDIKLKYNLFQKEQSLIRKKPRLEEQVNEHGHKVFEGIIDYIISISRDGGDVLCPIYEMDNGNSTIHYFFVLPRFCKEYMNSKLFNNLIILDGTFNTSEVHGTIIVYSVISPCNTFIPIFWGWALTESSTYITPGMELLVPYIAGNPDFIIDQGKALFKSINDVFTDPNIMFCARHLSQKPNMHNIFKLNDLPTKKQYDNALNEILSKISDAKKKERIKLLYQSSSRFYCNMLTLGHMTNNPVESINARLKNNDSQDILSLMQVLYFMSHEKMRKLDTFSMRNQTPFSDFVFDHIQKYENILEETNVRITITKYSYVYVFEGGAKFKVIIHDDNKFECDCHKTTVFGFPCLHIYAYLKQKDKLDLFEQSVNEMFLKRNIQAFRSSLHPTILFDKHYSIAEIKKNSSAYLLHS